MPAFSPHDEHEAADLRAQVAAARRYLKQLTRHPDPRDPDHPDHPEEPEDPNQWLHDFFTDIADFVAEGRRALDRGDMAAVRQNVIDIASFSETAEGKL